MGEKSLPMASIDWLKPKISLDSIVVFLNEKEKDEYKAWKYVDDYHALMSVDLTKDPVLFNGSGGILVKTFYNEKTGEIKTFAINYLDIPERPKDK
jgi:hypothetical protein